MDPDFPLRFYHLTRAVPGFQGLFCVALETHRHPDSTSVCFQSKKRLYSLLLFSSKANPFFSNLIFLSFQDPQHNFLTELQIWDIKARREMACKKILIFSSCHKFPCRQRKCRVYYLYNVTMQGVEDRKGRGKVEGEKQIFPKFLPHIIQILMASE